MCLPTVFLRFIVRFNALITILLGLMALVIGIIVGFKTSGDAKHFLENSLESPRNAFVVSSIMFGVVTTMIGIMGWYGGYKKNGYLLALYNLSNLIFLLIFFTISLAAFYSVDKFVELDQDDCNGNNKWSESIYNVAVGANENFCFGSCPCQLDPTNFPEDYFQIRKTTYIFTNDSAAATEYSDCPFFDQFPNNQTNRGGYNVMNAAENYFGCAGWCEPSLIYQFSNINNGPPSSNDTCFIEVTEWIHYYGQTIGAFCFTISSIIFLSVIFTFCLCLHPEKKGQKSFYDRIAYYND